MRDSSWKGINALAMLAIVPLVLACQPGEEGQQEMEEVQQPGQQQPGQQQPGQQQPPQQEMGQSATESFTAVNESGVTGDAQFTRTGNTLTVNVMAQMGGPGDYPAHIHDGTCDQPGGVVTPLNTATAAEPGIAEASTEVDAGQLQAGSDYLVMVHDQQGEPAACVEIPESVLESGGGM